METMKQLMESLGVTEKDQASIESLVETVVAQRVETALAEQKQNDEQIIAERVELEIQAKQAEMEVQTQQAIQEFVAENKENFVKRDEYDRMESMHKGIIQALAEHGIGTDNAEEVQSLNEQVSDLNEQVKTLQTEKEELRCALYLTKKLSESDLTYIQQDKVMSLMEYTNPENYDTFVALTDRLISEVKKAKNEEDEDGDDEDDKKDDGVDEEDDSDKKEEPKSKNESKWNWD